MRHPRVRRPFVVETRGSGREGGSTAIPKRVPPAPQQRPGLAAQAALPVFDPWAQVSAPAEQTAPRRILPNIMAPPEPAAPEADIEAAPPEETRLPRVRRVKPLKTTMPRAAKAPEAAPEAAPPPPARLTLSQDPAPDAAPAAKVRLLPRAGRAGRAALPAGQRWKARLPRACW